MRIVYSTEFLLSVGDTDRCKKLPPGFDAALLRSFFLPCCISVGLQLLLLWASCDDLYLCLWNSELQEVSAGVLERSKGHYTTPLGRSDGSGGYSYSSRGGSSGGMWDTRSSGSSDRDTDLPDRESLTQGKRVFLFYYVSPYFTFRFVNAGSA